MKAVLQIRYFGQRDLFILSSCMLNENHPLQGLVNTGSGTFSIRTTPLTGVSLMPPSLSSTGPDEISPDRQSRSTDCSATARSSAERLAIESGMGQQIAPTLALRMGMKMKYLRYN